MHVDYPNAKAFQGVFVVFKLYSNIFCFLQQIWMYIQLYIYIHILYAFLHATPTKLYLEVSWVRFSRSSNLDFLWHPFGSLATCHIHLSLSLHCRLISISLQGFEGHSPHLFLSLSPFRLQQQQLWNINAASWTQSASKSQKLSRCCNTLKAAGSYSLQPAASPLVPSYLHSYVYVTLLLFCYAHSGLATDVVAFVQESPHNAPLKFT